MRIVACVIFLALVVAGCSRSPHQGARDAEELRKTGHFSEALQKFEVAANRLPTNAIVWNQLGLTYHQCGKMTNALAAYQRALQISKDRDLQMVAKVRYNLGCLHSDLGNYSLAEAEFRALTVLQPRSADAFLKLGEVQLKQRQWDNAERSLNESRRLQARSPSPQVLNDLGVVQLQKKRPAEAYSFFIAALQIQRTFPEAILNSAILDHVYLNNHQRALTEYKEYLAVDPNAPDRPTIEVLISRLDLELSAGAKIPAQPGSTTAPRQKDEPPKETPKVDTRNSKADAGSAKPDVATVPIQTPKGNTPRVAELPRASANSENTNTTKAESKPSSSAGLQPVQTKVVSIPAEPEIRTAKPPEQSAPVAKTITPLPDSKSAQNVTNSPLQSASSRGPSGSDSVGNISSTSAAKREGFLQKINPAKWFKSSDSKKQTDVTPLPTKTSAKNKDAVERVPATVATVTPVAVNKPQFPKYRYQNHVRPMAGDSAKAAPFFNEGVTAQDAGKFTDAITAYEKAVVIDPAFFQAHYNLSFCAAKAGLYDKALLAAEVALGIQQDSAQARYHFGSTLQKAGYADDAADQFNQIVAANPSDARAHFALGYLYAEVLRDSKSARPHYLKVLELEPKHSQAAAIRLWLAANP